MSLSDCIKCWETPCICGHEYAGWTSERRGALVKAVLGYDPCTKIKSLRKALEDIKRHQEIVGGGWHELTGAWRIADRALRSE